jgi:Uma2 family endonuclease
MSLATKILPHYTYDEYRLWEGRWEIIEGIPYAMSPAPNPRHQWISSNIKGELRNAIKRSQCKSCKVYDFIDIKIAEDTVVQPDAVVVCKEITKPFLDFPPALVVEILSLSTAMKDRNNKFYQYQSFGIRYYLIVDTDKSTVEIYQLNAAGQYQLNEYTPSDSFHFQLDEECAAVINLNDIWE